MQPFRATNTRAELPRPLISPPPSRIVVGEVPAEECLDLLLALNSGLPGMATVHANSAREALVKLCTLPLLAGENISTLSGFGLADWPVPCQNVCVQPVTVANGVRGRLR